MHCYYQLNETHRADDEVQFIAFKRKALSTSFFEYIEESKRYFQNEFLR